jgi:hypothetical protein
MGARGYVRSFYLDSLKQEVGNHWTLSDSDRIIVALFTLTNDLGIASQTILVKSLLGKEGFFYTVSTISKSGI